MLCHLAALADIAIITIALLQSSPKTTGAASYASSGKGNVLVSTPAFIFDNTFAASSSQTVHPPQWLLAWTMEILSPAVASLLCKTLFTLSSFCLLALSAELYSHSLLTHLLQAQWDHYRTRLSMKASLEGTSQKASWITWWHSQWAQAIWFYAPLLCLILQGRSNSPSSAPSALYRTRSLNQGPDSVFSPLATRVYMTTGYDTSASSTVSIAAQPQLDCNQEACGIDSLLSHPPQAGGLSSEGRAREYLATTTFDLSDQHLDLISLDPHIASDARMNGGSSVVIDEAKSSGPMDTEFENLGQEARDAASTELSTRQKALPVEGEDVGADMRFSEVHFIDDRCGFSSHDSVTWCTWTHPQTHESMICLLSLKIWLRGWQLLPCKALLYNRVIALLSWKCQEWCKYVSS